MDFFDCYRTSGLFVTNLCCNDSRSFFFTGYSSALIYRCDIFCICAPGNGSVICCICRNQCRCQCFTVIFQDFQF